MTTDIRLDSDHAGGSRRFAAWSLGVFILVVVGALSAARMRSTEPAPNPSAFSQEVDLSPLSTVAVLSDGRLKSYSTHAQTFMQWSIGPKDFNGQSHAFTLMDMLVRPEAYEDASITYVKNKALRAQIALLLQDRSDLPEGYAETFMKTGRIAPALIEENPSVIDLMARLRADALRTAKHVEAVDAALALRRPDLIAQNLRVIPPADGSAQSPWESIVSIWGPAGQAGHGGSSLPPELDAEIRQVWLRLIHSWVSQDAPGASEAIAEFASLIRQGAPGLYPDRSRLEWESWYATNGHMTWVWMVYLLAVIPLLLSLVYRWKGAQISGVSIYFIALALHTSAVMLRWYVADRWPNSNMFEAVTTSAWFGAVGAIAFEFFARRTPMRNLFYLGAAVTSMAALMSAHFMPANLNPAIGNMMPVLHDVWLYIHTNVIIFSYVVIAMAAVSATLYLLNRLAGAKADYARAGGAASMLAMGAASADEPDSSNSVSWGQVLDGVTMVLLEVAFVMLWAGIVMGAIWADHSWGRPWGWDPKEVFALNTFVIFIILLHIRMKVRDKGLWTAWLAVIGFISMLFNWIVINFIISGLHSYA